MIQIHIPERKRRLKPRTVGKILSNNIENKIEKWFVLSGWK
jgi:hypothetical protein